jgi:iron complex outermembrane receptor protein
MWWDGETRPYSSQPDNYKETFQNGKSAMYNLSFSNAGKLGSFRLSYTMNDNTPIQYGSWNKKHSFSFNSTLKVSKIITTDFVMNYYKSHVHNRPKTMSFMNGFAFNRAENPALAREMYHKPDGYKYTYSTTEDPEYYLPLTTRSVNLMDYYWDMFENNYDEYSDRILANMTVNFQFTDWLKLRARGGTDYTLLVNEQKVAYTKPKTFNANQGQYNVFNNNYRIWYGDAILSANKEFGDFDLGLDLGTTITSTYNTYQSNWTKDGLDLEGWYSLSNSVSYPYWVAYSRQEKLKGGVFGILNVGYKDFAFIEGSVRQEQASTLPPANNTFVYPSIGTSLIYSQMFDLPKWWNFGKFRASYGITGKEPDIYAANNAYNSGSVNSVTINSYSGSYGNDQIKPERKYEFELGVENKMFDNRLGFEITYYNNRIKDNILWLDVPTSSGISRMLSNAAEIKNTGLEIALYGSPVKVNDFEWNSRFNIGFNKNEVVSLANGIERLELSNEGGYNALEIFAYPGRPFGDIYSLHIKKDDNGNDMVDADGYFIRDQEYSYRGNITPKAVGGFGNTFTYKNIYLDFLIDFRFGGQMFSFTNYYGLNTGRVIESMEYRDAENGGMSYYTDADGKNIATTATSGPAGEAVKHDGLILPGVDPSGVENTKIIGAADYYGNTFDWGQTGLYGNAVYDNSYIKFREASLGYNFDKALVNKIGFQNLSVSLIGRNLFYIWKTIPNIDPEASNGTGAARSGIEVTASQPIRSIGFMLRASF